MNRLFALLCLLSPLASSVNGAPPAPALVWLCHGDVTPLTATADDSQWAKALGHVNVYKFSSEKIRDTPVDALRDHFAWLKAHKIALAVESPGLTWAENAGGFNVEGFAAANTSQTLAQKIKDAGGTLDYLVLYKPVFAGRFYTGVRATKAMVPALANNVAANLKQVWAIFPNCIVGDSEPVEAMPSEYCLATATQWVDAFRVATGRPLAFFHDEIQWNGEWRRTVPSLATMLAAKHVEFGVVFSASIDVQPDAHWVKSAEVNIQSYNGAKLAKPAHIIFQSRSQIPAFGPETALTSFTHLVNYYFSPEASLPAARWVYRYLNNDGRHLFTCSVEEADALRDAGWISEGYAGKMYPTSAGSPGLKPLHRLSSKARNDHCFALATDDKAPVEIPPGGYVDEGIIGYVFEANNPAGDPFYWSRSPDDNFYTIILEHYNSLPPPWEKKGPICAMVP